MNQLSEQRNVSILTETTWNVFGLKFNRSIDRLIAGIEGEEEVFRPNLLVTLGGAVVSKKVKAYLRHYQPHEHWHINASNDNVDTYQSLTKIIPLAPEKNSSIFKGEIRNQHTEIYG